MGEPGRPTATYDAGATFRVYWPDGLVDELTPDAGETLRSELGDLLAADPYSPVTIRRHDLATFELERQDARTFALELRGAVLASRAHRPPRAERPRYAD